MSYILYALVGVCVGVVIIALNTPHILAPYVTKLQIKVLLLLLRFQLWKLRRNERKLNKTITMYIRKMPINYNISRPKEDEE